MSIFKNGVLGFIPEKDWLTVGFDVQRQGDPIDGLFGDERTDNLVAYWQSIASDYMLPGIAQFHAFDTEAQKAVRIPIDTRSIGNLSVQSSSGDIDLIVEVGPGQYKKHFINLNGWTTYVVEDVSGAFVDKYHYEVNFLPEMIVPITFTSTD